MEIDLLKLRAKAFDHLFDAVVVTDNKGTIIDWNQGSEQLYGYSKSEIVGQAVSRLHVPEDSDHITAEVISTVAEKGQWSGEIRMLHKNGSIGWIESMCIPILDDGNEMIGALGINRNITKRKQQTQEWHHRAHFDQLTQIPNRYLMLDRLSHLIERSARNQKLFSLLYIDVDKFKAVNDTYGHAVGDLVLVETVNRIKALIRKSDTFARIGGDEFVLLLENTAQESDINLMSESIYGAINNVYQIQGLTIKMSCSIGVAIYPKNGETTDELLSIADSAMYKAKDGIDH